MMDKRQALANADALLALGLEEKTFTWWFDFFCLGRVVRIRPVGLIHLSYSTESPELEHSPYNVCEGRIECRRLSAGELAGYRYLVDPVEFTRECWIIGTSGGAEILLVCEDFTVEESALADRYPEQAEQG